MAKKKAVPKQPDKLVSVINLKGSPALRDWLSAMSEKSHFSQATITRLGFALWAKSQGYEEPPKR